MYIFLEFIHQAKTESYWQLDLQYSYSDRNWYLLHHCSPAADTWTLLSWGRLFFTKFKVTWIYQSEDSCSGGVGLNMSIRTPSNTCTDTTHQLATLHSGIWPYNTCTDTTHQLVTLMTWSQPAPVLPTWWIIHELCFNLCDVLHQWPATVWPVLPPSHCPVVSMSLATKGRGQ